MVVLAANEGVLPMEPASEGIFSVDEKEFFKEHNFPIGHLDELKMTEENVAMYRLISKPYERLYMSWLLCENCLCHLLTRNTPHCVEVNKQNFISLA